jgi:hypothetical protein
MVDLENYIYFDICIFAIEEYEKLSYKTKQSSFRYYCNWVTGQIVLFKTKDSRLDYLLRITKKIKLLYGLREETAFQLVIDFFLDDKFIKFEVAAQQMLIYFPNSFC